jgi:hypothetical protein
MAEQFSQRVQINVDVDTSRLKDIDKAAKNVTDLDDKFSEKTGQNIAETADALGEFNESLGTIQTDFDGFEDNLLDSDDPLANFTGAVQRTQKEVGNLNEATKEGFEVEGKVDTDTFVDDLRKSIEEDIIENDDLPAVSPRIGETAEFENRAALSADITEKVKALEKALRGTGGLDVEVRIDDSSDIKTDAILGQILEDGHLEIPLKLGKGFDDDTLDKFENKITNIADSMEQMSDAMERARQAARDSGDAFEHTVDKSLGETQSFKELAEEADNLAQLKDAVTKANKDLSVANEDTAETTILERIQQGNLADDLDILSKAQKNNLDKKERQSVLAKRLAANLNGVTKASNSLSKSSRRVRSRLDDTRDSLRASSKVGELFEDGLGSLSLNLGAFTLALRNFLTQVPLLLAALGALGAAATAVVGSFIAAAAAIGTVVAAGAVAKADSLKEKFSDIEETGEALQKVFQEVRRLLFEAVKPLIELDEATSLFERTMVGLAKVVNIFAQTFADQIGVVEELFDMLGDAIMSSVSRLAAVFAVMIDALGKDIAAMTASAIKGFANLLLFSTKFFLSIEDGMGSIRNLIDATKQMAFVGKDVFGGLAPIIDAFSAIVEGAARIINGLDDSFVSAAVTATVLLIAFDKVSGVLGTIISLVPALSVSLRRADGSLLALTRSFGSFLKQHPVIFAGFTSLSEAVENLGDENALVTSKLLTTQGALDGLDDEFQGHIKDAVMAAQSMDEFEDELTSVAIQLGVTEKEAEEINDELQKIAINSRLASSNMDSLGELDPNTVLRRRQQVGIEIDDSKTKTPTLFDRIPGSKLFGDAPEAANELLGGLKSTIADAAKTIGGPIISNISRLSRGLGSLASRIPVVGGLITSIGGSLMSLGASAAGAAAFAAPLVAFLLLLGAVAVGVMGNMDKIKESLAGFGELAGNVLRDLGSYLLNTFIRVWNALTPAIEGVLMFVRPLMELFAGGAGGGMGGGFLASLIDIAQSLVDVFIFLVDITAKSIKFLGALFGPVLAFIAQILSVGVLSPFFMLFELLQLIADQLEIVFAKIEKRVLNNEALGELIDDLSALPNLLDALFDVLISNFNKLIPFINMIPGLQLQEMSLSKGGGRFDVSKKDVVDTGKQGLAAIEGKTPAQFSYEEYNNTTNNTNVDAQPEDTATISRVVEDAIREANSFGRRTAGGQ